MKLKLAAYALLLLAPAWAEKLTAPADASSRVDRIFSQFNRTDTPGCAVGATIDGETVLSAAYGMADLEHNIPLTPNSVFEAGSVSKQFTAAAVLLLVQQGKISLDDPVSKYIPEIPTYSKPLTIRHMLNHTSGLRDWGSVEGIAGWPRTTRTYTHAHVLDIVSRQRDLNYPPGAEYSYSNTGYNLLAILVSRVSGQTFQQFSRNQVFNPLDMSSTQWRDDYQRIVKNRAIAYTGSGESLKMLMPFEDVYGNGGLLTTVGDLLRWNQNFTTQRIGGAPFVAMQQQRGQLTDGRTIAYAAGLMILNWKGLPEVSHSGSTAGYRAWLGRYPGQGLSIAVLCNQASANPTALGHAVAGIYLASLITKPSPEPTASVDSATLASLAGLYRSDRDHETVSLTYESGRLEMDRRGATLRPLSANLFQVGTSEEGARIQFTRDPIGLRILSEIDGGTFYEKVEPARPTRADLQAMAGTYTSEDTETVLTVTLETGGLIVHRRPDTNIPLKPTYRDGFSSTLGSIRFLRDSTGAITSLSIGEGRVWDMRFQRVK